MAKISPMLAHYQSVKADHPDHLIFYRMGDFYELFFDDAVAAAGALDITLTKRGQVNGEDVAMAGVPVHASEAYLERLIRKGFRVAICEQMEDPAEAKKRKGADKLVRRDVVRLVTPGTITEDTLLDARRHNMLVSLAVVRGALALAAVDMSTGTLTVETVDEALLPGALARLEPREILLPDTLLDRPDWFELWRDWKTALTPQPGSRFDSLAAEDRLKTLFGVSSLDAFGAFTRAEVAASGALVGYIELTQKGRMPRLSPPRRAEAGSAMEIDAATRRSLELTRTQTGERKGSLLATIDRTLTGAGARLLAARLAAPLTQTSAIRDRHDSVAFCLDTETMREDIRRILKEAPDIERALSRLSLDRGGPRDLAAIRDGLKAAARLRTLLQAPALAPLPSEIDQAVGHLGQQEVLIDRLDRALAPDLPTLVRDGGFIASDYAPELDRLRTLRDESRRLIAGLQARYQQDTKVPSLKIRHNNVLGYFVEVTSNHADKLAVMDLFIHRQTMANAARFSTVELGDLERDLSSAGDKAVAIEKQIFEDLRGEVLGRAGEIAKAAEALAVLDVSTAAADLAREKDWSRPRMTEDMEFHIRGGRHPVVETALAAADEGPFIANDCDLSPASRIWLLTGPNMAGKSTFLRQNALIAVLAQTGFFVPAEEAEIGVVDRLFSRVGAADDLARGRSTFMVEMVETAAILHQATERSLVILDEIGRGTATFDGLSIAWATVEHLHEVNLCRTLFATHYHELTTLQAKLDALSCHSMRVKEWQDEIVFLHEVVAGAADRSYGIHVAKLAGLPKVAVTRAESVLETLEQGDQGAAVARLADDLPLFQALAAPPPPTGAAAAAAPEADPVAMAIREKLSTLDPDNLTPREALEMLYALKQIETDRT
ncbi:MAG: DNA mismatch repair protein MutS [Alphaproteobacteria bacterium]|nr:DNA mismatch repair protein MutS [Alphaproteobacteria bacterium]